MTQSGLPPKKEKKKSRSSSSSSRRVRNWTIVVGSGQKMFGSFLLLLFEAATTTQSGHIIPSAEEPRERERESAWLAECSTPTADRYVTASRSVASRPARHHHRHWFLMLSLSTRTQPDSASLYISSSFRKKLNWLFASIQSASLYICLDRPLRPHHHVRMYTIMMIVVAPPNHNSLWIKTAATICVMDDPDSPTLSILLKLLPSFFLKENLRKKCIILYH